MYRESIFNVRVPTHIFMVTLLICSSWGSIVLCKDYHCQLLQSGYGYKLDTRNTPTWPYNFTVTFMSTCPSMYPFVCPSIYLCTCLFVSAYCTCAEALFHHHNHPRVPRLSDQLCTWYLEIRSVVKTATRRLLGLVYSTK